MATTRLMTAEDLLHLADECRYDLIRGELIRMSPAGRRHGRIAATIARLVGNHVAEHEQGEVHGAETGFILARDPDTVLAPDFAFVRAERLTPDLDDEGYLPLAPDLVVEVVSPNDRMTDVTDKVMAYLDAGVQLVWIVQPRQRIVTVYGQDDVIHVYREDDEIDCGEVIPGLRIPVSEIFA